MEVGKECEPYLTSLQVIEILQKPDLKLHKKVFDCLRKFRKHFYSFIPLIHFSIPKDILIMCADDAFATTERVFLKHVKDGSFKPDTSTCLNYFRAIFKRNYIKIYSNEVKRKYLPEGFSQNKVKDTSNNAGEEKMMKQGFMGMRVQQVLDTLNEEDKKTYKMVYEYQLKRQEIADALDIQPAAVSNKIYRFHQRFAEAWKNTNKNNNGSK